jgi:hypothetical protein
MRILGYIEHLQLKITVFKADNRLSVKFENPGYEQTFKLGDDDRLGTLESARAWVDAALLEQVMLNFQQMHRARLEAMARAFPPSGEDDAFETII